MSNEVTSRLSLPMLQPGQSQKELFHNEALALLDIAVSATVMAIGTTAPPATPDPGQCWVVGSGATGDWAGRDGQVAGWSAGGWRYIAPSPGMAVWSETDGTIARFWASGWRVGEVACNRVLIGDKQVLGARAPAIASASGGSVVDSEARVAIDAVLGVLRGHGLIEN